MRFLVDTNFWIVYLKGASLQAEKRLAAQSPSEIAVCSIVWAELLHGARKYGNREKREAKIAETLGPFISHSFDDSAAHHYARIRDHLERRGEIIGGNDLMIAAIALTYDHTLVTQNTNEFNRIPDLRTEDWTL